MGLVQVLGNPIMAKVVDSVGKVPAIISGCCLLCTSMSLLPYATETYQVAGTLIIWSMGSSLLSTAPVSFVSDLVKEDKRAQAIALLRTAGDVGLMIGASGTGVLADLFSKGVALHSNAGLLLTATGWFSVRQLLSIMEKQRN